MGEENLERVAGEKGHSVLPKDPHKKGLSTPVFPGFVPNISALGGWGSAVLRTQQPTVSAMAHPPVPQGKHLGEEQAREGMSSVLPGGPGCRVHHWESGVRHRRNSWLY